MLDTLPLIVIIGPTASGKTSYAIELAQIINGEIVCADSRTVYRELDIGTAKPSAKEQAIVPHWGLDLVNPDERFTLYDFQQYAKSKITEIRGRGHVPMLVGGTGLYINSIIYNYQLEPAPNLDMEYRQALEKMSLIELKNYAISKEITLPKDWQNKRRLIRAIERGGVNTKSSQLENDTVVIGIKTDKSVLEQRSRLRSQMMLNDGLIDETRSLLDEYGLVEPLRRNAYGIVGRYLTGELDYEQIVDEMVRSDMHLVKKQLTWWRKDKCAKDIMWGSLDYWRSQLIGKTTNDGNEIIDRLISEYKKFHQ